MAYTPVKTVNEGDKWSANDMNVYVKANFEVGVPDLAQAKGDLFVGTGIDAAQRLPVGANDTILTADSAQSAGVRWVYDPYQDAMAAKGDLYAGVGADAGQRLAVGSDGQLLMPDSNAATGLKWGYEVGRDVITGKGNLIVGIGAGVHSRLSVGSNGTLLTADSAQVSGLAWRREPVADVMVQKGDLAAGTGVGAFTRHAIGSSYKVLMADSGQTGGLAWFGGVSSFFQGHGSSVFLNPNQWGKVPFPTGWYTNSVSPIDGYRFRIDAAGYYLFVARVSITDGNVWDAGDYLHLRYSVNGVRSYWGALMQFQAGVDIGMGGMFSFVNIAHFSVDDEFAIEAYKSTVNVSLLGLHDAAGGLYFARLQ